MKILLTAFLGLIAASSRAEMTAGPEVAQVRVVMAALKRETLLSSLEVPCPEDYHKMALKNCAIKGPFFSINFANDFVGNRTWVLVDSEANKESILGMLRAYFGPEVERSWHRNAGRGVYSAPVILTIDENRDIEMTAIRAALDPMRDLDASRAARDSVQAEYAMVQNLLKGYSAVVIRSVTTSAQ